MPKAKGPTTGYEVIDDVLVRETVELFVDFAEKHKLPAKLVMVAMEVMVEKIKKYLQVETVTVHTSNDSVH